MQAKSIGFLMPVYHDSMKTGRPARSSQTNFAVHLRRLREVAGLSQREVARHLGIAQPSYAHWEIYNVALKPEQLTRLAKVLGVQVEELLAVPSSQHRRGGPAGKMRRLFEAASTLPRGQQQKVAAVLEAFVAQHSERQVKPA